jgi:predicted nucleic acid-binding protein
MTIVLDASICASWHLPDETNPIADIALEALAENEGIVPALWWFEIRNILIVSERRSRITVPQVETALSKLNRFKFVVDRTPNEEFLLKLARTHRLTVYDATYLELAIRMNAQLATLDRALLSAAKTEGVALIGE